MNTSTEHFVLTQIQKQMVKAPKTRDERDQARRYRQRYKKRLIWLAGHARKYHVRAIEWQRLAIETLDWELPAPLKVPRSLQRHLGKTIGGRERLKLRFAAISAAALYYGLMNVDAEDLPAPPASE